MRKHNKHSRLLNHKFQGWLTDRYRPNNGPVMLLWRNPKLEYVREDIVRAQAQDGFDRGYA